jgi:tetratricopeptide (TPR) repeat protein
MARVLVLGGGVRVERDGRTTALTRTAALVHAATAIRAPEAFVATVAAWQKGATTQRIRSQGLDTIHRDRSSGWRLVDGVTSDLGEWRAQARRVLSGECSRAQLKAAVEGALPLVPELHDLGAARSDVDTQARWFDEQRDLYDSERRNVFAAALKLAGESFPELTDLVWTTWERSGISNLPARPLPTARVRATARVPFIPDVATDAPFVGREDVLAHLHARMAEPGCTVVAGPLGAGKSRVAAEAVRRAIDADIVSFGFWIDGRSADAAVASLTAVARALDCKGADAAAFEVMLGGLAIELERRGGWCGVLDDGVPATVKRLLAVRGGHWLIAAAGPRPEYDDCIDLPPLVPEEAAKLVLSRCTSDRPDVIARAAGCLPLGCLQLANLSAAYDLPADEILTMLDDSPMALLGTGDQALAGLMALRLERCVTVAGSRALFDALCWLAGSSLPRRLLKALRAAMWLSEIDPLLHEGLVDQLRSGHFQVPALIASAGRARQGDAPATLLAVADALLSLIPEWPDERSITGLDDVLPHASTLVGRLLKVPDGGEPLLRAGGELALRISRARRVQCRWEGAEQAARQACALLATSEPVTAAEAALHLANLQRQRGHFDRAEGPVERTVALLETMEAAGPLLPRARSVLGRLRGDLERHEEAIELLRDARDGVDVQAACGVRERAVFRTFLADALQDHGTPEALREAVRQVEDALGLLGLRIPEPQPWSDDEVASAPVTAATALETLAAVLALEGQPRRGLLLLDQCEAVYDRCLGETDNRRVRGQLLRCRLELDLERPAAAHTAARRAREISREVFGEHHPQTITAALHVGAALAAADELTKAHELLEAVRADRGAPPIAVVWATALAARCAALEDPAIAAACAATVHEAVVAHDRLRGARHPSTVRLMRMGLEIDPGVDAFAGPEAVPSEGVESARWAEYRASQASGGERRKLLARAALTYEAACGPDAPPTRRIGALLRHHAPT